MCFFHAFSRQPPDHAAGRRGQSRHFAAPAATGQGDAPRPAPRGASGSPFPHSLQNGGRRPARCTLGAVVLPCRGAGGASRGSSSSQNVPQRGQRGRLQLPGGKKSERGSSRPLPAALPAGICSPGSAGCNAAAARKDSMSQRAPRQGRGRGLEERARRCEEAAAAGVWRCGSGVLPAPGSQAGMAEPGRELGGQGAAVLPEPCCRGTAAASL